MIINPLRRAVRRRGLIMNPTATQWALITAGSVAGLTLLATTVWAGTRPSGGGDLPDVTPGGPDCDPTPYVVDEAEIRDQVIQLVDAGERDKAYIAQVVATFLFGTHPLGGQVEFPPVANPKAGVTCVWDWTIYVIDVVFDERGIIDEPGEGPMGSLEWVLRTANDPGYPWEEPVLQVENFPTPGMFVDIGNADGEWKPSNGFDSMIKAFLGSALAMAGGDVGLASNAAGQSLRKQARQAVTAPGGFNDLLYGQTNANYAGGNDPNKPGGNANAALINYMMNEDGRGLHWRPWHKENLQRIPVAQAPKRSIRLDGSRMSGANRGNQQMLVWLPALDLEALAKPVPTIKFLTWSDGSSTIDPPPQIRALGVDMTGVDLPGVTEPGIGQGGGIPPLPPPDNGPGPAGPGGFAPFG